MSLPPQDWPHRAASHAIRCPPHDWHVQVLGDGGPDLLLLHGAGGASHSWAALAPLLAGHRLIIPDLPGQGFTRAGRRDRFGLPAMAADLARLCEAQGWRPAALIGHSAGAAIALELTGVMADPPRAVVGINAALAPFDGLAGWLFPLMARAMATSPFVAPAVAWMASQPRQVDRLLDSTGSLIDVRGRALYRMLAGRTQHVDGTLAMMAAWRLQPLIARMPEITLPVLLLAGATDGAVPPRVSAAAARRLGDAEFVELPALGHLAHEEDAATVAAVLRPWLDARLAGSGQGRRGLGV